MTDEIGLTENGDALESGVRNWFASLLVFARNGCQWACEHIRSESDVDEYHEDGFFKGRIVSACHHWRWVFHNSEDHVLPFSLVCEELGMSEAQVRRRIMAQCRPNRDINNLVTYVLKVSRD